jgi:peptidoglycan pentaglycine glycine transferase (the first glycine)
MNTSSNIIIKENTNKEQWNTFVGKQALVHIMQSYEWGELNQYLGARVYRLGAFQDGKMVGAMQLHVVAIPIPVLRLNYLYCIRGPIVEDPNSPAIPALVKYAQNIARKERAVVLRADPNIPDDDSQVSDWLQTFHRLGFQTNVHTGVSRRSWVLDLRPSAEQLLADFKMTWRQNVRSSERKGVTIREVETDADFDAYYNVLQITSKRDDFFIHSKDYHKEIYSRYKKQGQAVILLAEHEGEVIATKMLIRMGDWCWDMFGGSTNSKRNLKATYLIQYRCFLWAKEQGCTYFDFRAIPNILKPGEEMWGVYEFKKGFSGFSRLVINTQDYIYNPLLYKAWNMLIEYRRTRRNKARSKLELERVARGQQQQNSDITGAQQSKSTIESAK